MARSYWGTMVVGMTLALLLVGCPGKAPEPAREGVATQPVTTTEKAGARVAERLVSPYGDEQVAAIDGYPLTAVQLERFYQRRVVRMNPQKHGGHEDPIEDQVEAFRRYLAVIELGVEADLDKGTRMKWLGETYELAMYADDYKAKLPDTIALTKEETEAMIPSRWVRMDLDVKAFASIGEAQGARARIEAGEPWEELEGTVAITANSEKMTTGDLFPGSGFFDAFDDSYLFDLPEGAISRAVISGLGPALVKVVRREDMDREAVDEYLATQRRKIAEQRAAKQIAEEVKGSEPSVNLEALDRALRAELDAGVRSREVIAWFDDGALSLDYDAFRLLVPVNYNAFLPQYPGESWAQIVAGDVRNLGLLRRLGRVAKEKGISLDEKWTAEQYDFTLEALYDEQMQHMFALARPEVPDQEVRAYADDHPEVLVVPGKIHVEYLFTPERGPLEDLLEQSGGDVLEALGRPEVRTGLKQAAWTADGKVWGQLYAQVKDDDLGPVPDILESEMGYYLARILGKAADRTVPYEEVKDSLKVRLEVERAQEKVKSLLEDRVGKMDVQWTAGRDGAKEVKP